MNIPPIDNPFKGRFEAPLTAEDVEEIEKGMNMLIRDLFKTDPARIEKELEMPLPYKIEQYVIITEYAVKAPHLKETPGIEMIAPTLRELLKAVNAYYNGLN